MSTGDPIHLENGEGEIKDWEWGSKASQGDLFKSEPDGRILISICHAGKYQFVSIPNEPRSDTPKEGYLINDDDFEIEGLPGDIWNERHMMGLRMLSNGTAIFAKHGYVK